MANLDPKVAALLDSKTALTRDDDEDGLLEQLEREEDDSAFSKFREQRLQQLHAEVARERQMRNAEHGVFAEVADEKQLMDITTSSKLCIVHFFKADFNRCRIMDAHLETLAAMHLDTRFVKIDVTNAPFLVVKLKVQVLPCVIAFIDGQGVDRIVGFEGLGRGTDNFSTQALEARLVECGALVRAKMASATGFKRGTRPSHHKDESEDYDDDEWE